MRAQVVLRRRAARDELRISNLTLPIPGLGIAACCLASGRQTASAPLVSKFCQQEKWLECSHSAVATLRYQAICFLGAKARCKRIATQADITPARVKRFHCSSRFTAYTDTYLRRSLQRSSIRLHINAAPPPHLSSWK